MSCFAGDGGNVWVDVESSLPAGTKVIVFLCRPLPKGRRFWRGVES